MANFRRDLVTVEDALNELIRYREYLKVSGEDYLDSSARSIILWHFLDESDRLLKEAKAAIARARDLI